MDTNSWSLLLGVAGLGLGLISAYAQLKAMTLAALRTSGNKARELMARKDAEATLFASNPCSLIAYIVQSGLFVIAVLLFGTIVLNLAKDPAFQLPSYMNRAISFAIGGLIGSRLAFVQSMMRQVRKKASKSAFTAVG